MLNTTRDRASSRILSGTREMASTPSLQQWGMVARPGAGLLLAAKKGMEGFLEEAVVPDVFIEIAKNQSQTLSISAL